MFLASEVIGLLSTAICTFMGMLITKSVKQPVLELEKAAKKLSKGELDSASNYVSKDEFGSIADNFGTALAYE